MIIDRSHRAWGRVCLLLLLLGTGGYVPYHLWTLNGPSGGSLVGLVYGFLGYGLMLFAGALGARARRPTWRLGRAETWLKGHIWLGLLAFPLILFHAGFAMGGTLTFVLMVLFGIVTASGIVGVVLQNILPRTMMDRVPLETIYEQIDHVLDQIRKEADTLVLTATDPEAAVTTTLTPGRRAAAAVRRARMTGAPAVAAARPVEARSLKEFYEREVRPYLRNETARGAALHSSAKVAVVFAQLRTRVPPELHAAVDELEAMCEERRQLRVQVRLHHLLHGWLLIHVPLSLALLGLSALHAVIALRY
jgi:hypothetical protein